ncbi:MAG: flavin reductase family protein [Chloroflexi bacterium]|nr:flavin reductase family protein [Chloroflexota bacterium]
MTLDPRAFRQTVGLFATGVTVVAAEREGDVHGMTANAVSSLSLDPMLVLVCVGKQALMASLLQETRGFSINILREDQESLSTYFAGGWKEPTPPPFRFVPWDGGPRLEGCAAAIGCERHQILEGGDHWIVIGRVVALHQGIEPRKPLLFYGGRYGRVDTSASTPAPDLGWVEVPVQIFYDPWQGDA